MSRRGCGVAVTGFLGDAWHGLSRSEPGDEVVDIAQAIEAADAEALYHFNPEFIPSWCPQCHVSYCDDHWSLDVAMADDFPGWYEATYGACSEGHRRRLDD